MMPDGVSLQLVNCGFPLPLAHPMGCIFMYFSMMLLSLPYCMHILIFFSVSGESYQIYLSLLSEACEMCLLELLSSSPSCFVLMHLVTVFGAFCFTHDLYRDPKQKIGSMLQQNKKLLQRNEVFLKHKNIWRWWQVVLRVYLVVSHKLQHPRLASHNQFGKCLIEI